MHSYTRNVTAVRSAVFPVTIESERELTETEIRKHIYTAAAEGEYDTDFEETSSGFDITDINPED